MGHYDLCTKFRAAVYSKNKRDVDDLELHYSDLIKSVLSDSDDQQSQANLLLMLQEGVGIFTAADTTDEIVASLKSCFNQLKVSDKYHLQSQIPVTMTSILLQCDKVGTSHLTELIDLLIDTVLQVKRNHPLIREACCNCLMEIETFFPGTLQKHLESVWAAFQRDSSWACQNYAMVAGLILEHLVDEKHASNVKGAADLTAQRVSALVNFLPWATPQVASIIVENIMHIAVMCPDVPSSVLKPLFPKFVSTHELSLMQLAPALQLSNFAELQPSEMEKKTVLQHLFAICSNTLMHSSFKYLILNWIDSYLQYLHSASDSLQTITEDFHSLLPMPVDMPDMQGIKLKIIITNLLFSEGTLELVVHYLRGLKKTISSTRSNFAANLFFHCVYRLYADFQGSCLHSAISKEIARLVMDFITSAPTCCHNFLNFLECVEHVNSESQLSKEIISDVVESITNQNLELCLGNLQCSLVILTMAVQRPPDICKPQLVLKFVQNLVLHTELPTYGDWVLGNQLLDLCCSVMLHQRRDPLYPDLCKVFLAIMERYNDADVRSRAKVFYAALYALSESKIKKLLQSCSSNSSSEKSDESVAIPKAAFPLPSPVIQLSSSIMTLTRCERKSSPDTPSEQTPDMAFSDDMHQKYWEFLRHQFSHAVKVSCKIILEADNPKFDCLLGLQLQFFPPSGWGRIKSVEIPLLWKEPTGYSMELCIVPRVFHPCHVNILAEFTCQDERSYRCELAPFYVEFEDLLVPFPVLPDIEARQASAWRRFIFHQVWQSCIKAENVAESCSVQSVYKLDAPAGVIYKKIEENVKHFVVSSSTDAGHVDVGILAPSNCHILFIFKPVEEFTAVSIVTQSWKTLSLIQSYLEKLSAL